MYYHFSNLFQVHLLFLFNKRIQNTGIMNSFFLVTLFLLTNLISTIGQSLFNDGVESPWIEGEITLTEGTLLKGVVQYRHEAGIINYKPSTEALESKTFLESRILKIILRDPESDQVIKIYSLPFKIEGKEYFLLFEILKEFDTWAVLSRKGPVYLVHSRYEFLDIGTTRGSSMVEQVEGIYIMDENGEAHYYLQITSTDMSGLIKGKSSSNKLKEKNVLKEKMGGYWADVELYAKRQKLKFNDKGDLMKILNYYEQLVQK